ncbi:uncharacterized protein LOC141594807 [Silene latifolia]|uniref:uncharacterized protein LOC141594807 n=1 Tax=Silene latifolia TaxID=37657 RepID=UPI003D77B055
MEINNYPLTCWWNGEVEVNGEDISYKGGCESFVIVNSTISLNELKSEIYESLEVDKGKYEINIKMKFPSVRGYKVLSLSNDRSLKAMWASVCQSKAASMDLFMELMPLEITQTATQSSNLSFTNMLSQVEDPNWSLSLSTNNVDEAPIDGNIFGDEIENVIEEEDTMLLLSDEDDMIDLVSQPCTNTQFIKVHALDVDYENSWYKSSAAPFKNGEEFNVEQEFASKEILRQVVTSYNVLRNQTWVAKQRALVDIYGDWEESYAFLPRYLDALKEANPGTAVHFVNKPTNDPNFQLLDKVFWSFGPSINGFPHCRPIITIDGTHLYGKYQGVMLIAMGVDANDQLFPLAFAIVEKEDYENWSWFWAA